MKKTKYLVLSAAAILAVGCKGGSARMPEINDETAVAIATKLATDLQAHYDAQTTNLDAEKIPFKKLTITKTFYETYEDSFEEGNTKWTDEESYKLELDISNPEALRASFEIKDSDTGSDPDAKAGPSVYEKYDFVYKDSTIYICENHNNIVLTKREIKNVTKEQALEGLIEDYYYDTDLFDWYTGTWSYLSGYSDVTMNYIFSNVIYVDDEYTTFPGFLPLITGVKDGVELGYSIITANKAINDKIKEGGEYTDGSYSNLYFGATDPDKKANLYCESNTKLGYIVDLPDGRDPYGNKAVCDYKTNLSFEYNDGYMAKSSIDHAQNIEYRLADQKTGEYKKRTAKQSIEIKRDAKIADINLEDYLTETNE